MKFTTFIIEIVESSGYFFFGKIAMLFLGFFYQNSFHSLLVASGPVPSSTKPEAEEPGRGGGHVPPPTFEAENAYSALLLS